MKIPVALLVRVSTDRQETARQTQELQQHADANGWTVLKIVEETMSGAAQENDRTGLAEVMVLARAGTIRKVLVHEVSRIARRNSTAHRFLEELEELGVSLYWHSQRIETLLASGKRNPAASIMFSLLAEMARSERETLRERVKSGLEAAKRAGKVLGRPKGTKCSESAFLRKYGQVVRALDRRLSIRAASKFCGVAPGTVVKVRRLLATAN